MKQITSITIALAAFVVVFNTSTVQEYVVEPVAEFVAPTIVEAWGSGDYGSGCCSGGDGGGGWSGGSNTDGSGTGNTDRLDGGAVTAPAPKPKPKCDSLTVSSSRVEYGKNVVVKWRTSNANRVRISHIGTTNDVDGQKTLKVTKDMTFNMTVYGGGGSDTCSKSVRVDVPTARCDLLTVSPSKLPYGGGTVTVKWRTTDATRVHINHFGNVNADGSRSLAVRDDTSVVLSAYNVKGQGGRGCTTRVNVAGPTKGCTDSKAYNYNPKADKNDGSCKYHVYGCTDSKAYNYNKNATKNDGSCKYYTYGCTDPAADNYNSKADKSNNSCIYRGCTDKSAINYDSKANKDDGSCRYRADEPRCDFFTVSDNDVDEGDEVELEWGTSNATEVYIDNGVGYVPVDGDEEVRVYDDTRFTLTARNSDGEKGTCTVAVRVEEEEEERPRCEIRVSDDRVRVGDEVTVEWESRDADEVEIEDDHGREYFDDDVSNRDDGEFDVTITRDTEFTMKARGDGGTRTCDVEVEIDEDDTIVLTERGTDPRVAGIALTQVPYTGFEAGPALTILFYTILTLWALAVAYYFVIRPRQASILQVATIGGDNAQDAHGVAEDAHTTAFTNAISYPDTRPGYAAHTAAAPQNLPTGTDTQTFGYAAIDQHEESTATTADPAVIELEELAHRRNVLVSRDAVETFIAHYPDATERVERFTTLITRAHATYPTEDGWTVLNETRMNALVGEETAPNAPVAQTTDDSLVAALASGDVTDAYRAIAHRPMVAVADAAALLDAAYRARSGADTDIAVPAEIHEALKHYNDEIIKEAVNALTSALDGTYTDESAAVKIAVMKAVKVFHG